ncbi:unnamed protein product [Prunus armeniaca]|uniref:Uncharacterized protein n=1 Tax=Prunus armeniaca TaxID=36596 RepID=A0A6J5THM5_PRUAR|nr:unnamed protein product [Prunus armeniaca]
MEKVKLHTPDMVMLLETKTRSSRYVFLKKVLGMPFMHAMEVGIKDVEKGCVWRFFGVYASTDDPIRRNQWQALRTRILTCQEAVMVMEDFNDFLDRAEKQGGNSRSERNDKRKEYKNGWTGGLPMIIGYDFSPPQKISIGWLKGLIMLCFVSIHMRPRGGRKGILHMIRDGGGMRVVGQRGLLDWKRREWKNSQLCIDELRLELRAEYQNDIFDYGKVKELEFKLQKALVGKVKELEFKFKISHIFREGNHRVDALANHGVQGSGFTW